MFNKILQLLMKIPILQNVRLLFYFYDRLMLLFIKKPKPQSGKKQVLLVFPFALGDSVMLYGDMQYLKDIYKEDEYEITVTCQSPYAKLFGTVFENVLPIPYTKASVSPKERFKMLKALRGKYYDIALDPIGSEECTPNVYAMNAICAKEKIGILLAQDKKYQCPKFLRKRAYTKVFKLEEKNVHRVKHYAQFFSMVAGKELEPKVAQLPVSNTLTLPEKYFIVYPSASIPVKQWPVESYAKAARRLYEKLGIKMLLCGTNADKEATDELIKMCSDIPMENMLGKTSVLEFIEVIGRSELVLTNDTSVYHIAAATGRKTIVVSGGYVYDTFLDYHTNGYGDEYEKNIRICAHKSECMNCSNNCKFKVEKTYPCVLEVTEDEVLEAVDSLLSD